MATSGHHCWPGEQPGNTMENQQKIQGFPEPSTGKMLPLVDPTLGFKSLVIRKQDLHNDTPAFCYSQRTFELRISNPLIIRSLLSNNQ